MSCGETTLRQPPTTRVIMMEKAIVHRKHTLPRGRVYNVKWRDYWGGKVRSSGMMQKKLSKVDESFTEENAIQ